jgi:LmbE family N-acetylglucosaminyl deacetylase
VTEGTTQQYNDEDLIDRKKREATACADRLGVANVHFVDLPDMRLYDIPHVKMNAVVESACNEVAPDIIYTHSRREVNRDQIEVHDSTLVATRPSTDVSTALAYETPSSSD